MSCLVDSGLFIAYADQRDQWHTRSIGLLRRALNDREFGSVFLSDYIVDEVLTFTYSRIKDKERTLQLGRHLLSSDFNLLHVSPEVFQNAWALFQKTSALSFTDCTTASLIQDHGIPTLLSFDSDFDSLGVHRVS